MRWLRTGLSSAVYQWLLLTRAADRGLRILMYHRVTDAHPDDRLCVPPHAFAAQMHALHAAGYRTVTFAQAIERLSGGSACPPKSVVLTFDDGFEDNFLHAAPALARHGFSGCFFVPSGFLAAGPGGYAPADRPMTWEQLRELASRGHEIGAHAVTHRKLTMLALDEARAEIRESKRTLEQQLGRPVEFFCYPAGDHNPAIRAAVQAAGYRGACTVAPGANAPGADRFALRRTEISAFDSPADFTKKLAGAYDWLHAAVQWTQRHTRAKRDCANAMTP